jgi:hypothetical protein
LRELLIVTVATALFIGLPSTAGATNWKCYRSAEENHHCYALSQWDMVGCPKECVDGGVADIETSEMDVPGWESGDFVTNEMWESSSESAGWVESGQIAGNSYSCCSMHPFFAAEANNGKAFYMYEQPGTIGSNRYNDYVIQDLEHNGIWRIYWGYENTGWVEVHAYSGYPAKTDELEAGMEAGANTEPTVTGSQFLASVYGSPESWHPWEGVYAKVSYFADPETCIEPIGGSWPGNAIYHTHC